MFSERQATRLNKEASNEQNKSADDTSAIQDLDVNLCSMPVKTLNFWLTKFVLKVCKRHLAHCNGISVISVLDKNDNRYKLNT